MARIKNFNPPADIAALLGNSLNFSRGSQYASASAYPSNHQLRTSPPKMPWSHPYNLGQVADWLIQYGPARWRDGSRPAIRTEILNDLASRAFAAEFWTAPTPVTDRIEVAYPTVDRDAHPPPDPADPLDTANTDCDYEYRSTYWPFAQASEGGWPPLPGWRGAVDAERYFVDTWHAQRSLTYKLPPLAIDNQRAFILLYLQGAIRANAEESGVRLWFTPLTVINFFGSQSSADGYRYSIAEDWTHLYDAHLALPPANLDWYHAVPIDRVFKLNAGSAWGWSTYNRWLNLKLSTHAPCGVYRASNAGRSAGST
jgi:hypothetical protein